MLGPGSSLLSPSARRIASASACIVFGLKSNSRMPIALACSGLIAALYPVVLTTGYSAAISPEQAKAIGIRELLFKPNTMQALAEAIRRALGESKEEPGPSILLVDDDEQFRSMLREVLTTAGYRVQEASDGSEGLKLCESQPPDLLITDL